MKIKRYLNLLLNPLKIETISIAIKLRLFDLSQKALALGDIQEQLNFDESNAKIFLEALVQLGLLKHKNNFYKNSSFTNKYFVSSSESYIGDMFLIRKDFFESNQKNLFDLLENGQKEYINYQDSKKWAKIAKKYFFQEQKALLSELVIDTIKNLKEYKNIKKILDLGCSSGVVSLELLQQNSHFEAVLFDFENVMESTRKNIKKYKLEDRVTALYGDVQKDDIKDDYDLVICSNILHLLTHKQEVLQKIYTSLNKNGILLIIQSNFLKELSKDENSYFYNLIPMLNDKKYTENYQFSNLILKSGFKNIHSFISNKSTYLNTKVYIAKK